MMKPIIGFVWGEEWIDNYVAQSNCFLVLKQMKKDDNIENRCIDVKIVLWETNGVLYYRQIIQSVEIKSTFDKITNFSLWLMDTNYTQGPLQVKEETSFIQFDSECEGRKLMIECGRRFTHSILYNDIKNGDIHFELMDWLS